MTVVVGLVTVYAGLGKVKATLPGMVEAIVVFSAVAFMGVRRAKIIWGEATATTTVFFGEGMSFLLAATIVTTSLVLLSDQLEKLIKC